MEAGNNAGALVKEGFVFLDGKRLFARLFSSSQLFLFASNEDAQPLQQIACGPELKIQGENSVETEKWSVFFFFFFFFFFSSFFFFWFSVCLLLFGRIKALVDIAKFQEDRSRVILEAMPADVRESLLPAVNAAPVSSNKSGESVRLLVRTLTGTSASHTVARGATVLQLKQLLGFRCLLLCFFFSRWLQCLIRILCASISFSVRLCWQTTPRCMLFLMTPCSFLLSKAVKCKSSSRLLSRRSKLKCRCIRISRKKSWPTS
jgi:hypothetical protein